MIFLYVERNCCREIIISITRIRRSATLLQIHHRKPTELIQLIITAMIAVYRPCSANRLPGHARRPWLNGSDRKAESRGQVVPRYARSPRSHRSGWYSSGRGKYSSMRDIAAMLAKMNTCSDKIIGVLAERNRNRKSHIHKGSIGRRHL